MSDTVKAVDTSSIPVTTSISPVTPLAPVSVQPIPAAASSSTSLSSADMTDRLAVALGITAEQRVRAEGSDLRYNYHQYLLFIQAEKKLPQVLMDPTRWSASFGKPTKKQLIEIFVANSSFHSYWAKLFPKVADYPPLEKWLLGSSDAPADVELWGQKAPSYKALEKLLVKYNDEHKEKGSKGKGKEKEKEPEKEGRKKKKASSSRRSPE